MSITHTRVLSQFLIQMDGEGKYQGAHVAWLDRVAMPDGRVFYSPQPLQLVSCLTHEEGCPLHEVLDEATLTALSEVDRARKSEGEAIQAAEAARAQMAEAQSELARVTTTLAEVAQERDGILLALAEEAGRREALHVELESVRQEIASLQSGDGAG